MQGFPRAVQTAQDIENLLALVQAGQFPKDQLIEAIAGIEQRAYLRCPVQGVSTDKKTVTVCYCAEAAAGQVIGNGSAIKITAVKHVADSDGGESEDEMPAQTSITLSKVFPTSDRVILIAAPNDPLEAMGLTAKRLDEIKGAIDRL